MMQITTIKADEAVPWLQKRLKNYLSYGLSSEECKVFEIFITSTLTDVEIKKQITNTVIPSFFENLVSKNVNKQAVDAQVSIVRLFMKYYGPTCGQFKNTSDKFTSKTLREYFNEDNIVFKVTKYLALFPQCGGRGQQGINHAEAWTNQFNDYVYSANYFLYQLYSNIDFFLDNVTDIYEGKFDISVFNLSDLEKATPKERYEKLTSVFIFFNTAIQSMLLSMFSTVKHFDPNIVIQLALNTLSVTSEKLKAATVTEDVIELDLILWKLHCSVIKIISALIKCCGRILIPQGVLICRILLQSLNMTNLYSSNTVYGTTRSKLEQRLITYQVLCSWLAVAGSQSSLEMFSENLTSGILFDIKYNKPSLDLIVDKKIGNRKRKSGALNEKIISQRDTIVMHDYHANKIICNEAHKTFQLFLHTMSPNLKPLQFKTFQSTIMGLLLEIIKCHQPNDYPLPYYDNLCRLNLYKSLLATVISPHPQCITQTSVALRIFTYGTTDHDEKIKENCRSSLSKLEHIIRPRNDTLFFPLENDIEIAQPTKVIIPENKTHFLNTTVEDIVIPIEAKKPQKSNIDNIKPIVPHSETVSATNIKSKQTQNSITDNNKLITSSSEIVHVTNSLKYDRPTKDIHQEININDDKQTVEEKPQEQIIVQPELTKLENKLSFKTPINTDLDIENKIIIPMDVDSIENNESANIINMDDDQYLEMVNDFVCSD